MTHPLFQNTLTILALKAEAQERFNDISPIYCGVGKVNAAYVLTRAIYEWKQSHGKAPSLVLNIGSAGSTDFKAGSVINCTHFIQRDFDTTAFGTPPYATPHEEDTIILENGIRYPEYPEGTCGTGDNFATSGEMPAWNVVDMEAYAMAKVCGLENIPFACLKYITDGADGQAASSWEESLPETARKLREAVDVIFKD